MNNEEFLRLTTLYLEDAINADDLELLNCELTNSTDRVQQFNDLRLVTGLIKEHGCPVESQSSTNDSFVAGAVPNDSITISTVTPWACNRRSDSGYSSITLHFPTFP